MNLKTVLGVIAIAVPFFFDIIFALASVYESTRLIVSAMFFAVVRAKGFLTNRKMRAYDLSFKMCFKTCV